MGDIFLRKGCHNKLLTFLNQLQDHVNNPLTFAKLTFIKEQSAIQWEKLNEIHDRIISGVTDDAAMVVQEQAFQPMLDVYQDVCCEIADLQLVIPDPAATAAAAAAAAASATTRGTASTPHVKLPPIELPTFNGNFADWTSFKDLFIATVDNNTHLTAAQKLQYLKTSLQGEPSNLIRSMAITDANYSESWTMLNERYDNKREIVYSLVTKILNHKPLKHESAAELQQLIDAMCESLRCLKVLKCPTDHWDDILVVAVVSKLDPSTRRDWAVRQTGTDTPKFKDLVAFLHGHVRGLQASRSDTQHGSYSLQPPKLLKIRANATTTSRPQSCKICGKPHRQYQCSQFQSKSPKERNALVKKHNLCFNCLESGHGLSSCSSSRRCLICGSAHHTLLHTDGGLKSTSKGSDESESKEESAQTSTTKPSTVNVNSATINSQVILNTAVVLVPDCFGNRHEVRLFVDGGSQGEFISERCVHLLQLPRSKSTVQVTGFAGASSGRSKGTTKVTLISRFNPMNKIVFSAHIMPRLATTLPSARVPVREWSHLSGLQLADPEWFIPSRVDIIIGQRLFSKVMTSDRKVKGDNDPVAYGSIFGWMIGGAAADVSTHTPLVQSFQTTAVDISFLKQFWEIEDLPKVRILSKEEKDCEAHFVNTYQRDSTGRFIVSVPFNGKEAQLGLSRDAAVRRWLQVEKRLMKNQALQQQYTDFMEEYLQLSHMEEVPIKERGETCGHTYYLPHHFVLKEDSSTTKLRVVFDGSNKTTSGLSINDCMLTGAQLQDDLFDLLLRFRQVRYALKGDIKQMFRMFRLQPQHSNFHRIVWRKSPQEPVREYRLLTVTYGTTWATHVSVRCLLQLADDVEKEYPAAAQAIRKSMFVDDLLGGEDTVDKTIDLYHQLTAATKTARLELRKWCTNDPQVLAAIPEHLRDADAQTFEENTTVKTLGIRWFPTSDAFGFSGYKFNKVDKITMRILLSNLARVYDPLGFLTAVTIRAKLLYQELWKLQLGWDDEVPDYIAAAWREYEKDLDLLSTIHIPRAVLVHGALKLEIHAFSDASEKAYGGIIYIRSFHVGGITVRLVTSKSKVAPLKQVSLPRLELESALLATKLVTRVITAMNLDIVPTMWSDSTITLTWISSTPRRWSTAVANRVAKIQEMTTKENWRHVPGHLNPADMVSRGVGVEEMINSERYWSAANILTDPELPHYPVPAVDVSDMEERKTINVFTINVKYCLLEYFSSLTRLKRATAIFLRFVKWLRKEDFHRGPLQVSELQDGFFIWVRNIQQQYYQEDLNCLKKKSEVMSNSKLRSLHPFVDVEGIMRVSGRLQNAEIPSSTKHPIILPGDSRLVELLIRHYHHDMYHAGFQSVWSSLQREFWIVRGRERTRRLIRSCTTCLRFQAATAEQLMGQLPRARVTPARPFLNTGMDFAGPFQLKNPVGRVPRTYKGYLCLFICMATKAIHLEPVSSLTTVGFLDALRRFVSRRGLCADIFSDCGTNFVGADKEIRKFFRDPANNRKIADGLSKQSMQWHFNAPSAPHHGGLWEAGVKSAKHHLKRVMGNGALTFEFFSTILCQIEAILNSRPLVPLSNDHGDYQALTPGHFLIGEPLLAVPDRNVEGIPTNRLKIHERQQQRVQHFWSRWSKEYLNTLQQRTKWQWAKNEIRTGDLVLIVEETSPAMWKMGRIELIHPGSDGRVRVVTVRTATGVLKRPIVKLVPFPRE